MYMSLWYLPFDGGIVKLAQVNSGKQSESTFTAQLHTSRMPFLFHKIGKTTPFFR